MRIVNSDHEENENTLNQMTKKNKEAISDGTLCTFPYFICLQIMPRDVIRRRDIWLGRKQNESVCAIALLLCTFHHRVD